MSTPSPSIRAWAERLLAAEGEDPSASEAHIHVAVRVSEKLRVALTRFVGADGFSALQRRALALARKQVASLQSVTITADGRLEGMEEADRDGRGGAAMTANLLYLLVTFVGESLALRLTREAFPEAVGQTIKKSEES